MGMSDHTCGSHGQDEARGKQNAEIEARLGAIRHKILVMSGKGGVGKSSVAAYLSVGLAKRGFKVGLMDVDLHGPSIPRMLGLKGTLRPGTAAGKAGPVDYMQGMQVISIETLMGEDKDCATIWRGPLKIGVIKQFIADIEWDDLDFLVIDSPPGTGDEPLTVAQTIPDAKALIVTTPQEISLADVRKSINFCRQVNMEILGLVENMSAFTCPHCGGPIDLFKKGGGAVTAGAEGLALLASLPLEPEVVRRGDTGDVTLLEDRDLPFSKEFNSLVEEIVKMTETQKPVVDEEVHAVAKPEATKMLAIPVSDGRLSAHFGHCEQFALIETKQGEIIRIVMKNPPAHEPGVLPQWLHEQGAQVIIAGGMGSRAQDLFHAQGIEVVVGAPADLPEVIARQYLAQNLVTGDNVCDH